MAIIELRKVSKSFGALRVIEGYSLAVDEGAVACLVGPSGSGKSTVLRLIAGLERLDAGSIHLRGRLVSGDGVFVPPAARGIGMAFQDFALWPHMSVERHLDFVLKAQRMPRPERRARIDALLDLCQLEDKRHAYPADLSGGQQQRVGLARALAPRPSILLLDEPFSNLDPELRAHLSTALRRLREESRMTIVCATHDQDEAQALGDAMVLQVPIRGR